ncbi:IS1380-Spn1 transposase [Streptococcus pneumoniae]|nr:IS1380-Spn1 transposase [Streptococcus pneumoniae]
MVAGLTNGELIAPMTYEEMMTSDFFEPQLFTPNLKTIQNPCLSLDPGWFLFSPNGCFLLDKKEFPLYGNKCRKKHKKKGNSHEQFTKSSLPKQVFLPTIFRWRSFNPVWWSYLFSGTFFPVETKRADF